MSGVWVSTSLPILSDGWPPSDVTCSPAVVHALGRLVAHPLDDRDARVTEDHERVVDVADDAGELQLENGVESGDDALLLDLVVFAGYGGLLLFGSYHPGGVPAAGGAFQAS